MSAAPFNRPGEVMPYISEAHGRRPGARLRRWRNRSSRRWLTRPRNPDRAVTTLARSRLGRLWAGVYPRQAGRGDDRSNVEIRGGEECIPFLGCALLSSEEDQHVQVHKLA